MMSFTRPLWVLAVSGDIATLCNPVAADVTITNLTRDRFLSDGELLQTCVTMQ